MKPVYQYRGVLTYPEVGKGVFFERTDRVGVWAMGAVTSPVIKYDPETGWIETANSVYVPEYMVKGKSL